MLPAPVVIETGADCEIRAPPYRQRLDGEAPGNRHECDPHACTAEPPEAVVQPRRGLGLLQMGYERRWRVRAIPAGHLLPCQADVVLRAQTFECGHVRAAPDSVRDTFANRAP